MMNTTIQPGSYVRASQRIEVEYSDGTKQFHADTGSMGIVLAVRPGFLPTIFWESSGTVCDACPDEDFTVIEAHTP